MLLLFASIVLVALRRLVRVHRPLVLLLLIWLLVYGAFFFWWEPDNIEFWIAILPPALLLLVLALQALGTAWHAGVWLALIAGFAMLGLNCAAILERGRGDYTPQLQIARLLGTYSQPGDLLLVPDGLQELYLRYYEQRSSAVSLNGVLQASQGNWDIACALLQGRIEATLHSGAAVLIGEGVLRPVAVQTPYGDPLLERFALSEAQVAACFAPYAAQLRTINLGEGLPTYYRLPTAQEMLEGDGWDFTQGTARWGWQAGNVLGEYFDGDGWGFFPATDPYLVSPRIHIDTARYQAIQVRLAKKVSNREGQIFFMDATGIIEEDRSIRWELTKHSRLKTYHLDVRDHPAWAGVLAGLRIDPTIGKDQDDGEHLQIAWIKLIPIDAEE
ncbi:MAG: hypothetical protein HC876_13165 [Chloroflexaceae bacterium]|nr:hypothetical protein [Chloroflexaceae bacterium]